MQATSINRQRWVSKTISGFCATGQMMKRHRERDTDECPRCGGSENVEHIWKCPHETAELWDVSMQSIHIWLTAHNTHPEMARAITASLNQWWSDDSVPLSTNIPWLKKLIDKQTRCGWHNFFIGFLLKDWGTAMTQYLSQIRSRK